MVETQIAARGVADRRVLEAFRRVPRHRFLSPEAGGKAYRDHPLPIGLGQTISQPYVVALMTELAAPGPEDRVLEVGTGSGYQAAILAELAREVHTIERIPELARGARSVLESLGYRIVVFHLGDGSLGWKDAAPYDAIVVTAGAPSVPEPLLEQLAEGGRLVLPVGPSRGQRLVRVVRRGGRLVEEHLDGCAFVPLYGERAWSPPP